MKLQNFFDQHKQYKLTDDKKIQLYHKILQSQQSQSLLHRIATISKIATYSLISVAIVGSIWMMTPLSTNTSIIYDKDGFRIQQQPETNTSYRVSADSIGQVMQFQGSYTISNQGNFFHTNMIYNGDRIELDQGAYLTFSLNGHTTKVIGPAILEIAKNSEQSLEDEYFIHVIQGQFVEIEAQEPNKTVTIQKDDIAVHQTNSAQQLKIQIVEEKGETKVRNYGGTVAINTSSASTDLNTQQEASFVEETTDEPVEVDDDDAIRINIATITDQPEPTTIASGAQEIASGENNTERQNIIAILEQEQPSIIEETIPTPPQTPQPETNTKPKQEITTTKTTEIIPSSITTPQPTQESSTQDNPSQKSETATQLALLDGKQIPNEQQVKKLSSLLQKSFLENDIQNLIASMLYRKENGTNITLKNINNRLISLGDSFSIPVSQGTHIDVILSNSSLLIQQLSEGYHIPPMYIHNLVALQQWIIFLQHKELPETDETIDMDTLIQRVYAAKSELHFK